MDEMTPQERLALAVVEQAVADADYRGYTNPREDRKLAQFDAIDFLANRLWEEDCIWRTLLEKHITAKSQKGMQEMYRRRL
jgi:hypothetical protein